MRRGVVRAQRKPCHLPALRRRRRKPATCLRCATMCPMSPRAAGEGSLGLCAGGGLAGGGDGVRRRGAGLECARAPALCFSLPAWCLEGWWCYHAVARPALPSCVYKCC